MRCPECGWSIYLERKYGGGYSEVEINPAHGPLHDAWLYREMQMKSIRQSWASLSAEVKVPMIPKKKPLAARIREKIWGWVR